MVKKLLFTSLLMFIFAQFSCAQQALTSSSSHTLFAQGMFDILVLEEIQSLEIAIKSNPYVQIVRLDHYSNRFFLLTKDISTLDESQLRSWFGEYSDKIRCLQIGVHGIDPVDPFPFTNCSNN